MENNPLKQAVEQIQLDEDAKKRITLLCERKLTEKQPKKKKSLLFKLCMTAAVLALSSMTVYAVSSGFGHTKVVADEAEIHEDVKEKELSAYSVSAPGNQPTASLEEMVESRTRAAKHWTDKVYGADRFTIKGESCVMRWDSLQVTKDTAAFKKRRVYDSNREGFTRTEYTALNPKDLQPFMTEYVRLNPAISYSNYEAVPFGNLYYKVTWKKEKYYGAYFDALYGNAETGAWFTIGYIHEPETEFMANGSQYTVSSAYDEIYSYTTKDDFPFLIMKKGDTLWAECNSTHINIHFYGGYMDTKEVEQILDHLELNVAE